MQHSFYQTKKAEIFFQQYGPCEGKNMLLIHNAGGNHAFMQKQAAYFGDIGFNVLNVDLPGHGNSSIKTTFSFSIEDITVEIADLAEHLSFNNAVIVGLNYGGNIALQLANSYPKLVSHIILLDPPILMAEWVKDLVHAHVNELRNPHIENFAADLVESVGIHMNSQDKQVATEAFSTINKDNLAKVYENLLLWDVDSENKIKNCKTPMLHIQSQNPFCAESTIKDLCPHVITARVVGAGHWMTMETPEQVNDMIKRFVRISL